MSVVGTSSQTPRFSPDTLPGLRLWLDAADATTLTLSGSNVTQWRDKSGNLRNGTPVNGLTYSAASNAVVFTRASSQYLTLPDNTFPIGSSSFSIFFVFTPTATSYEIQLITAGARGGNIFGIRSGNAGTGTLQTFWSGYNDLQTSNLWAVKQRNIGTLLYQTGGTRSLWINGVQGASETSGGTVITTSNCIGTLAPGAFNTFDGQFHEVLVFESSLSVTERQQVEAYLAQKWDPAPSPLSVPGCVFWLDAGDRSTLTLSASNTITAWTEKSGANRTVTTNSTGIYSATAMNGRPGIQFSAGNVMTSSTAATLGNNLTVFAVFMATSEGPRQLNVPIFVGSSANGYWLTYRGDFQFYQARQEGGSQTANSYYRTINIPVIMAGVASATASQQNAFLNGYSTDVVNSAPLSNVGATTIYIPGGEPYWGGPANGMFNGVISEILIFSNAVTTTQRQTIEGYLSSKWGISVRVKPPFLPSTHAFPRAPPPVRAFSPLDVDGLSLWLDAADPATVTLSGSNVTQWRDKTGLNTSSSIAGAPALTTSALLNNQPVVRFNGSSDSLLYSSFSFSQPFTVFAVTVQRASGNSSLSFVLNSSSGSSAVILYRDGPNLNFWAGGDNVAASPTVAYTSNLPGVYSAVFNGASSFLGFNGQGTSNQNPGTAAWSTLYLGRDWSGIWQSHDVGEVLFYSSALSTTQRQQVETYLAEKWGLRASMGGVSHPHRYAPAAVLPTQISGCALWLDAADATTLTLSGSNVTAWADKSGNGRNATGGVSPTFSNSGVVFNGTNMYLSTAYSAVPTVETFFCVATWTGTDTRNYCIIGTSATNGRNFNVLPSGGSVFIKWDRWGVGGYATAAGVQNSVRFLANGFFTGSNGQTTLNGGTTSPTESFSFSGSGTTNIGTGVLGDYYQGTINEIVAYTTVLTTTQRQQIEGYLAWKWGLQASLPGSTAPFANFKRALTPVFVPNQIEGCALWLDAADATTLTLSGSNVTAWADKSGNGRNAVGTTSNPTYNATGFNSRPTVTFSNNLLTSSGWSLAPNRQFAWFVVVHLTSLTNTWQRFLISASVGYMNGYLGTHSNTSNILGIAGSTTITAPIATGTSNPQLVTYLFGTSELSSNTSAVSVNGGTFSTLGGNTGDIGTNGVIIGTDTGMGMGDRFLGHLSEIICYSSDVTQSQRRRIEGYLAHKWGLQANLGGVNHPSRFGPAMILPTSIPGCRMWLDAADATTLTLSGSNVTQWNDKSGQGFTLTVPSGYISPTYSNGVLNMSGSNALWSTTNFAISGNTQVTLFLVGSTTSASDNGPGAHIGYASTASPPQYFGLTTYQDSTRTFLFTPSTFGGEIELILSPNISGQRYLLSGFYDGTVINGTYNGTLRTSLSFTSANFAVRPFQIGLRNFNTGPTYGTICECICYTGALSTTDRQQIEGYLAWKWGLQTSLPTSAHPYRTFKP